MVDHAIYAHGRVCLYTHDGAVLEFSSAALDDFLRDVIRGRQKFSSRKAYGATHVIFGERQQYLWTAWVAREQFSRQTFMARPGLNKHEVCGLTILHSSQPDLLTYATAPR